MTDSSVRTGYADLTELITSMAGSSETNTHGKSMDDVMLFFESNGWFGMTPIPDKDTGRYIVTEEELHTVESHLRTFLSSDFSKDSYSRLLADRFPSTAKHFMKFSDSVGISDDSFCYTADFMCHTLTKEMAFYTDADMQPFVKKASEELTKAYGDILTFFIAWLRSKTKTCYNMDYVMGMRYTMDIQNEAYDMDEYLELLYYLLNEDYIEENGMYQKAAESMNYTDTWLYLSINFICSLRLTDLERIYHPVLPYPPDEVIQKVYDDTFTDDDARRILLSITQKLSLLPLVPNKTAAHSGIEHIKFTIPDACETHFGRLFALAEAHRQINGIPDAPIIRKISGYEQISRYMGDEIGSLFLESDFRSRSATKSYLQSIYMHADEILREEEPDDGRSDNSPSSVKGYILASLARSHKGSYGEFASTTMTYLKYARFDGLTPDFVAYELLQRGVCSYVPTMLLEMVAGKSYDKLTVQEQTDLHRSLGLSPKETDNVVALVDKSRQKASLAIKEAVGNDTDILSALHLIGSGQAFSKQAESLCLCSAVGQLCPYTDRRQCVGCRYEISTKSTFFSLISEIKRIRGLYREVGSPLEKAKYRNIATTVLLPKLDEMLTCIRQQYGKETFTQYEEYLKEALK